MSTPFLTTPDALALAAEYAAADAAYAAAWAEELARNSAPWHTLDAQAKAEVTARLRPARDAEHRRQIAAQTLFTRHLIPALMDADPVFAEVLRHLTGNDVNAALAGGTWTSGDQGGWHALSLTAAQACLSATDSQPSYPRLDEFCVEVRPTGADGQALNIAYDVGYADGKLQVDLTRTGAALLTLIRARTT